MLKTIRFAALGTEQANNRGKPVIGENPTKWHMFAINKTMFCSSSYIVVCVCVKPMLFL